MEGLHNIEHVLRSRGLRVTPQRQAVFELLKEHGGHPSADELYRLAKRKQLRISLSTVYRALDLFEKLGLVRALHIEGEQHRYETVRDGEHHHLICLGCGKVIEFRCDHCVEVLRELAERYDFRITASRVQLMGYCAECRKRMDGPIAQALEGPGASEEGSGDVSCRQG